MTDEHEPRALTEEEVNRCEELVSDGLGLSTLGVSQLIATIRAREAAIGQLCSYAKNILKESDYWCSYADQACAEAVLQATRIKELEAALRRHAPLFDVHTLKLRKGIRPMTDEELKEDKTRYAQPGEEDDE